MLGIQCYGSVAIINIYYFSAGMDFRRQNPNYIAYILLYVCNVCGHVILYNIKCGCATYMYKVYSRQCLLTLQSQKLVLCIDLLTLQQADILPFCFAEQYRMQILQAEHVFIVLIC